MSRAINVSATEAKVLAKCKTEGAVVSAIEALVSGGTRVVLAHPNDAETMRRIFAGKIIEGAVRRAPLRT